MAGLPPNLLDEMLAEAEAALSTPDLRSLAGGKENQGGNPTPTAGVQVVKTVQAAAAANNRAIPDDSPLPTPPSHFMPTASGSSPLKGHGDGGDLAAKQHTRSPSRSIQDTGPLVFAQTDLFSEKLGCNPPSTRQECSVLLETRCSPDAVRPPCTSGVGALRVYQRDEEHIAGNIENRCAPKSCSVGPIMQDEKISEPDPVSSLSPEEFKEKVDRKIAYFEKLARESRLKAQEEEAAEKSLQEARSRIEASAQKRRSFLHSGSAALAPQESIDQRPLCLGFGQPDSLSLDDLDLGSDACVGDVKQAEALPSNSDRLDSSVTVSDQPTAPERETVKEAPDERVCKNPKTMLGISPIVEANTPDLSNDQLSWADETTSQVYDHKVYDHKQEQLFWRDQPEVVPQGGRDQQAENVSPGKGEQSFQACFEGENDFHASPQLESNTTSWAGVLACPTPNLPVAPTPTNLVCPGSVANDGSAEKSLNSDRCTQVRCPKTSVLGMLDTFLESLRSPQEQDSLKPADTRGESEKCDLVREENDSQSELERKRRAAAKRATFLANANRMIEDASDTKNSKEQEKCDSIPEIDHSLNLQAVETRAQQLSEIASAEISLTNTSSNTICVSSHHASHNSSGVMSNVSPVLPQSFEGASGVHSITVVDIVGNTSSANASFGSSQQLSISSNSDGKSRAESAGKMSCSAQDKSKTSCAEISHAPTVCDAAMAQTNMDQDSQVQSKGSNTTGIGVQVKRVRGLITIVDLMPDGPAAKSLRKGQVILKIDGTGVETQPFKSVLAKLRGEPGSTVYITVVDSPTALKSGQEPRSIGVQRFHVPASIDTFARDQLGSSSPPPEDKRAKLSAFAPLTRADHQSIQDSGLCSPYSDPGDAIPDQIASSDLHKGDAVKENGDRNVAVPGEIPIDVLHNRLLERLLSSSASSVTGLSTLASELMDAPHETNIVAQDSPTKSSCAQAQKMPRDIGHEFHIGEEKFRCLAASTAHQPRSVSNGSGVLSRSLQEQRNRVQNNSAISRGIEFSKRIRSPSSSSVNPQAQLDKRMRHEKTPSLHASVPDSSSAEGVRTARPSRSTGPRKPAVPSFSSSSNSRSSSAPKQRPSLQERGMTAPQQQKKIGPSAMASARARGSMAADAFPKRSSASASSRTSTSTRTTRRSFSGDSGSANTKQNPRDNLQVYADVGRAVTSLVQKLTKNPDLGLPDKDEIMQALGKLTTDIDCTSSNPQTARTSNGNTPSVGRSRSRAAAAINSAVAEDSDPNTTRLSKREELTGGSSRGIDKENVRNAASKRTAVSPGATKREPGSEGKEPGTGPGDGSSRGAGSKKQKATRNLSSQTSSSDGSSLTFDAVLKSRFGLAK